MSYEAVVIGVSAGGFQALQTVLPLLDKGFPAAVFIVQHQRPDADDFMARHLDSVCVLRVKEAEDKEMSRTGTIYLAPANYHLLVEPDRSLALSVTERVNFSRPSIDVLFESAAEVFLNRLVGVVMTGANDDGARGLACIKRYGGLAVVQSPESAEADMMPRSAITLAGVDHVIPLERLGAFLNSIVMSGGS